MHLNKNQGTWSVISVWILMLYCLLNFVMHLTKIGVPDPSLVLRLNRCEHRSHLRSREQYKSFLSTITSHLPSLVWPDTPAVAVTFGSLNLVASCHKQLCQPPAANRLPCDLGMLWLPATTNWNTGQQWLDVCCAGAGLLPTLDNVVSLTLSNQRHGHE